MGNDSSAIKEDSIKIKPVVKEHVKIMEEKETPFDKIAKILRDRNQAKFTDVAMTTPDVTLNISKGVEHLSQLPTGTYGTNHRLIEFMNDVDPIVEEESESSVDVESDQTPHYILDDDKPEMIFS